MTTTDRILGLFTGEPERTWMPKDICRLLDLPPGTVRNTLKRLLERDKLQKLSYGHYRLADNHRAEPMETPAAMARLERVEARLGDVETVLDAVVSMPHPCHRSTTAAGAMHRVGRRVGAEAERTPNEVSGG